MEPEAQDSIVVTDFSKILQLLSGKTPKEDITFLPPVNKDKRRWSASTFHVSPEVCDQWLHFARHGAQQYYQAMSVLAAGEPWGHPDWYVNLELLSSCVLRVLKHISRMQARERLSLTHSISQNSLSRLNSDLLLLIGLDPLSSLRSTKLLSKSSFPLLRLIWER